MKFNDTQVFNFEGAFRGMRNPLESWDKSDSFFGIINWEQPQDAHEEVIDCWVEQEVLKKKLNIERLSQEWEELWEKYGDWLWSNECLQGDHDLGVVATLGPNDLGLAQKLVLAGEEHAKFMRQIFISVDITAPLYWYKQFDTYKIGTVANSTSTMHKLASKPIIKEYFELDDLIEQLPVGMLCCDGSEEYAPEPDYEQDALVGYVYTQTGEKVGTLTHEPYKREDFLFQECLNGTLNYLERLRQLYVETKDNRYWRALVQMLPDSWIQTRTVTMSYANLRKMYLQRNKHKLIEWQEFFKWAKTLPYAEELIMLEEKKNEIN